MIAAPVTSHIERLKEGENDTLLSASRGNQLIDLLNSLGAMEGRGGIKVIKSGSNFVITTSAEASPVDPFIPTGYGSASIVLASVTDEGADALRATIIGTNTEIIVAKPSHLQKNVIDSAAGTNSEHRNEVSISVAWEDYNGGIDGQPEWVLTKSHTNNRLGLPDADEAMVVEPIYYPQTFFSNIVCLYKPRVLTLATGTLDYDAAGTDFANWIDLNQTGRQWVKRTQAEYGERTLAMDTLRD